MSTPRYNSAQRLVQLLPAVDRNRLRQKLIQIERTRSTHAALMKAAR